MLIYVVFVQVPRQLSHQNLLTHRCELSVASGGAAFAQAQELGYIRAFKICQQEPLLVTQFGLVGSTCIRHQGLAIVLNETLLLLPLQLLQYLAFDQ